MLPKPQVDALKAAGCEEIFTDEGVRGIAKERDGLSQALATVKQGNVLVVWKLDRLGHSLGLLCGLVERLKG